jgi:hypothetical protein
MNQQLLEAYQACPYKAWRLFHENDILVEAMVLSAVKNKKVLAVAEACIQAPDPPAFNQNKHCPACPWQKECRQQLEKRDCISLLAGMPAAIIAKYQKRGIMTILQLSHLFRPRRRGRALSTQGRFPYELKALAIREQKTYVLHRPEIPPGPVSIYLDMEGLPQENFIYLIGGVIVQDGQPPLDFSFWADDSGQEEEIFQQAANLFAQHPEAVIYHYGAYETKALKRWPFFAEIEKRMVNLLGYLRTHVFPPVYGNGLKEVGKYIDCTWTDPDASGLKSIDWRKDWERTGSGHWKQKLLQYNLEDVRALIKVKDWLTSLTETPMKRHTPFHFHTNPEFSEDFQVISKAAYFDYQRSRIYWRTSEVPAARKSFSSDKNENRLGKGVVVWQPKQVNEIRIAPPRAGCPHCGHAKIYHSERKNAYRTTDLRFTKTGIKQWVIEHRSGRGKCAKCRKQHNDAVLKQVQFGDNLFAWAVNLYVKYHLSHEKISELLGEQFGIWANHLYFTQRKEKWFHQFQPEIEALRAAMRRSPVVHVDETRIKLHQGIGYVWVLATSNTVCYHFTSTRETGFLREWLADYTGVLITDFFPGYESMPMKRQKCLIHLIRDLNNDLFKNPFDAEFKRLVTAFGQLLRTIIATIDRYGLKRRHLHKHLQDIEQFHQQFLDLTPTGELAAKYSKRLRKHWDECWTFLHYDGVAWNNNNAETAIKAFAQHRRSVNGMVTQTRLPSYLDMLSLAQTCRYRNMSFLEVLRRKVMLEEKRPSGKK